jgi:hypothetical protein
MHAGPGWQKVSKRVGSSACRKALKSVRHSQLNAHAETSMLACREPVPQPCCGQHAHPRASWRHNVLTSAVFKIKSPGLEVGHYAGCVRAWRALQQGLAPGALPERAERGISSLEALVAEYPLYDPQVAAMGYNTCIAAADFCLVCCECQE